MAGFDLSSATLTGDAAKARVSRHGWSRAPRRAHRRTASAGRLLTDVLSPLGAHARADARAPRRLAGAAGSAARTGERALVRWDPRSAGPPGGVARAAPGDQQVGILVRTMPR